MAENMELKQKELNLDELNQVTGGTGDGGLNQNNSPNPNSKGKGNDIVTPEL